MNKYVKELIEFKTQLLTCVKRKGDKMRMTKRFRKWFNVYGLWDDGSIFEPWQKTALIFIGWRAYRRGWIDAKANNKAEV